MPDITSPQAVRFCNERVRQAANRYIQLYNWAKTVAAEFAAQDMTSLIPDDGSIVIDNSAVDGRPIITGADVHAIKGLAQTLIGLVEASSNTTRNQLLRVATQPYNGGTD